MNKLPFLKVIVEGLLKNVKADDEILIADGASTDGSVEYIKSLYDEGKIAYWSSAKDTGEPHGFNKLFFVAKGELIKLITDDDAFYYPGIEACKQFMLAHPDIDAMGTDGAKRDQNANGVIRPLRYSPDFEAWKSASKPFATCGLGTMMRRSSLPLLGLWNPSFRRADMEFMLRTTSSKAKIAWCAKPCFVNISNPQSISVVYMDKIRNETERLEQFYLGKKPNSYLVCKTKVAWRKLKALSKKKKEFKQDTWQNIFQSCNEWLAVENQRNEFKILSK